jgi:AcrR family transcriptional regulator
MAVGSTRLAPDDRRKAILDIARDVFLTEGYADASMSTIAARVGGSKGTLYNYFSSKEALFVAFMREECGVEAEIAYVMDNIPDDIATALKSIGCRLVHFILSDKVLAVHRLVVAESQRFPELGRSFYNEGPKVGIGQMAGLIQSWMDRGQLRQGDAFHASEQFSDLCKSGLHQRRLWNVAAATDEEIEANVDGAVAIFLAYYGV